MTSKKRPPTKHDRPFHVSDSEARCRTLLDEAPVLITMLDRRSRMTYANQAARALLPSEPVGREMTTFVHPDDRARVEAALRSVGETGQPVTLLVKGYDAAGRDAWYRNRIGPVLEAGRLTGFILFGIDITAQRSAELELLKTAEQLNEAQELTHVGSWEWDIPSNRLRWSGELMRIYGVETDAFKGGFDDFISRVRPNKRAEVKAAIDQALQERGRFEFEEVIVRPDGSERILHSLGQVLSDPDGRPVKMVGTCQDVTEERRTAQAVAETAAQLDKARELEHMKAQFVNTVAHELRTPITSIIGFAEFLEEGIGGPLSAAQTEFVAELRRGAQRLKRLVDDLLDYARIEAGTFKLACGSEDLARLVTAVVDSLQPQARAAGIQLEARLPEASLEAEFDAQRIEQVLLNLVGNAIKFTRAGGAVTVSACREGDMLRCEVMDTGIGIKDEDLPKLFQRFSQLEAGERKDGTGLGLNISKSIVEAHGGRIGVTSRPKKGSTFWFTLPAGKPAEGA